MLKMDIDAKTDIDTESGTNPNEMDVTPYPKMDAAQCSTMSLDVSMDK